MLGFIGDNRGPDPLPRQRAISFHVCWAIMVPAFCYAYNADAPLYFFIALPLAIVSLLKKRSYRLSNRAKVYSFIFPLITASVLDLFYKVDMNHFFMSVSTLCPLLILYGLSVSLLDQRTETIATGMACALGAMLIQGLTLSAPDLKRIGFSHPLLMDRFKLFIIALLAQSYSLLKLPRMSLDLNRDATTEPVRRQLSRASLTVIATVTVFGLSVGLSFGARRTFRYLDPFFSKSYREFLQRRSRKRLFRDKIATDSTLAWKLDQYGKEPAFFVMSDVPPGYMRGRVYLRYDNGVWTNERLVGGKWEADPAAGLPLEVGTGGLSANTWIADDSDKSALRSADVYLANRFKPNELYLPGNTQGVELIAERLSRHQDGTYLAGNWDETTGYRYHVSNRDQAAVFPQPAPPGDDYLQSSAILYPTALLHAAEAIGDKTDIKDKIRAVVTYLKRDYTYSLTPDTPCPEEEDPVVHFLQESKQGHCELFASAAVAMLRSQGIKCRYVTGFVCSEQLPGDTFVARFKHCHAWAEAWVPDEGWTFVEATPASGVPDVEDTGAVTGYTESVQNWFVHILAGVKRGYFAQSVISGYFVVMRFLGAVFLSVYGLIAWPALLLLLRLLLVRWRRKRQPSTVHPNSKLFMDLRRTLMKFLAKRGIAYEPTMSLRELAAATPDDEFKALMLEYERLRYGPQPEKSEIQSFFQRFSDWTQNHARPVS